ncbi:WD repeat-containing protein 87-like [Erinaceus europaeus]|uniref:WD repeat-containing protein 87-like n=1 Tax=Erinaceus europaeus TaxID=9365 RepID=A0A1S3AG97_ERIEU|nr:WD repeat-containing protein 87-like [Erinaceus europaeus]
MAQRMTLPGQEFVQGLSVNGPQGSVLAFCENNVRVLTHQGQGRLKEVKQFMPVNSGSAITCSYTCVSQGYFYAGNRAGEIHAWGLDQRDFFQSFQAHSSLVLCIHSRPEIHTLLTAGGEGLVKEWDLTLGSLLRQLPIHKDLQQLQFVDNTTFFCLTSSSFSLHRLPCFYSLFNICGSAPQNVKRVYCGQNWTRILCATKDGLVRFLSPVTGELLVITWPLLLMDKAMAWAYDSQREELFVVTQRSEVLVFDTTCSPCTVKYLMCTSESSGDRVRCLAYGQAHLGKDLIGLMFCGHDSGTVTILSHLHCAKANKTIHSGAVLSLSTLEGPQKDALLCSYGMDNTIYLTEASLEENKIILEPVIRIVCGCFLMYVILMPGSVGAITENHSWRMWHFQDFLRSSESEQSFMFKETKHLHQCNITAFDVCVPMKLFVTGGADGTVRIWDFQGTLMTELDSAFPFGPLCFANSRGDLLVAFNQSLYLVSCLKLFPPAQLIYLSLHNNADEIQEVPKPFLPSFFFSFGLIFVPKFTYLEQGLQEFQGLEALANKRIIAFDKTVPHVVEGERRKSSITQETPNLSVLEDKTTEWSTLEHKDSGPQHKDLPQLQLIGWDELNICHILKNFFGQGRKWPLAPDGYIPNSVVRARLWPEGTPIYLHHDMDLSYLTKDWDMSQLTWKPSLILSDSRGKSKLKPSIRTYLNVLINTTYRNWMEKKFDEGLINNLVEVILSLTTCCSVKEYKTYIAVLAQIFANYEVSPELRTETASRFIEDTVHPNPQIRKLSWEGMERLGLMSYLFAIPLTLGLLDSDERVRAKALSILINVTGIRTKTMLVDLLEEQDIMQEMQ